MTGLGKVDASSGGECESGAPVTLGGAAREGFEDSVGCTRLRELAFRARFGRSIESEPRSWRIAR